MNVEENVTLLSCPFCGHKPMALHIVTDGKSLYSVGCSNVDCLAYEIFRGRRLKVLVKNWNKRSSYPRFNDTIVDFIK